MRPTLRPYQARAVEDARAAFSSGARAVLLVLPTGGGKTFTGGHMICGALERGASSVVWFAHRTELLDQAARSFRALGLRVSLGGDDPSARVHVLSPQTCLARRDMPTASLVFLDEAHHYVSSEWRRIPDAYLAAGARLVGLTATPERSDGTGLGVHGGGLFDGLVTVAQVAQLVDVWRADPTQGLVPIEVVRPAERVRKLAQSPADAYAEHAPGTSALVFAPHVQAATDYAAEFEARGIECRVVSDRTPARERAEVLARFAAGDLRVVANVMVLTEGFDAPIASTCILARKTSSASLYLQMVGRVRRPAEGKTSCTLIDLVGARDMHGHPDEDREYHLDGVACTRVATSADRYCRVCKAPLPAAGPCSECSAKPAELVTPQAEGVALEAEKFAWAKDAAPSKQLATLVSWHRAALAKGHKTTSANYKFKAVFRRFPDASLLADAKRALEGEVALARAIGAAFAELRTWAPTCADPPRLRREA